jgi:hypothetical protein
MSQYQANLYPKSVFNPTVANADASRKSIGVCFSGGGSRALSCAWGQLIGLASVQQTSGKRLLDDVRYISSVSGGSWASVLYTFRPNSISEEAFLGRPYLPSQLYYNSNGPGGLNVSTMGASSLGKIPQNFSSLFDPDPFDNVIVEFIVTVAVKGIELKDAVKWLWMYIVGKNVLDDFSLYTYSTSLLHPHETPWNYADAKYFTLSDAYANAKIFPGGKAPSAGSFVYAHSSPNGQPAGPMLIVNANIVGKSRPGAQLSGPIQIPVQFSPVASGIYGANPQVNDGIDGGAVESFAFSSQLLSQVNSGKVSSNFNRAYALVDITACSSAFYAATLASPLQSAMALLMKMDDNALLNRMSSFRAAGGLLGRIEGGVLSTLGKIAGLPSVSELRSRLLAMQKDALVMAAQDFVPQYNYWPVSAVAQGARANQNALFTDGGDLENTGVAGLIAQVQGNLRNILAFVNGSEALEARGPMVVAATQMAPLFGVCYDPAQGFKDYLPGGINPFTRKIDPTGFLQIFDNSVRSFDALRQGLYVANGAGAASNPAFFQQRLRLVDNPLLGIKASSGSINVLWVQNAKVNAWQSQISDGTLKAKLQEGQRQGGIYEFADFPYYSTFFKIHQTAAETNTLAQMWAWCVGNPASTLNKAIVDFFAAAGQ